jgi:hypothetical protein
MPVRRLHVSRLNGKDVPKRSGRTVFVARANTGLGFETSKVLAAKGVRVQGYRSAKEAEDARWADCAGASVGRCRHRAAGLATWPRRRRVPQSCAGSRSLDNRSLPAASTNAQRPTGSRPCFTANSLVGFLQIPKQLGGDKGLLGGHYLTGADRPEAVSRTSGREGDVRPSAGRPLKIEGKYYVALFLVWPP